MPRLLLLLCLAACSSEEAAPPALKFKSLFWTAAEDEHGQLENKAVDLRATLPKGALVGWKIELAEPGHIYVFRREGDRAVLHATVTEPSLFEVIKPQTPLETATQYHVVASREPIEWGDDLARQIDALRAEFERLDSTAARPTRIGGQVRTVGDPPAIELHTNDVGCWTYTIDVR